jgi:feruloyl esterase
MALADKIDNGTINATDPNLKAFVGHGGKLLLYHGWNDQLIAPRNAVNYYQSVLDTMGGASKIADSVRLFMAPGMNHCAGGDGPNVLDTVSLNGSRYTSACTRCTFPRLSTRATISPSPLRGWYTYWSWSLAPQMSAPPPVTENVPDVTSGAVDRTRPLCAYPKVAQYKGSGSTDEAANFVCKAP